MKIAILGWYYQKNAGDDRILECLTKKINTYKVEKVKVFTAWNDLELKSKEINECDYLLVGGGGLILRNTNRVVPLLEKISIPWAFIGVSVDSVGSDNLNFIKYISKNAKFILVRDLYSFETFSNYRKSDVYKAPDLTFLYPYQPNLKSEVYNRLSLSLRPWRPNLFSQYTRNYHRFNRIAYKFPLILKVLGLWDIRRFSRFLKEKISYSINFFPLQVDAQNGDNILMINHFDMNPKTIFDIENLKESDFLIGMRLHSLIFATQVGVPFIALSYASKVDNYIAEIGLEEFVVNVNNYKSLAKKIDDIKNNKRVISKRLIETTYEYNLKVHKVVDKVLKDYVIC